MGYVGRMLKQADVAAHQGWRYEAKDLPQGVVPGHDGQHNTQRVPAHIALCVLCFDGLCFQDAFGVLGVIAADIGALRHFKTCGCDGFAHLRDEQRCELVAVAFQQQRKAAHPEATMLQGLRGVAFCGAGCELKLGLNGLWCQGIEAPEHFTGGRVQRLNHPSFALHRSPRRQERCPCWYLVYPPVT